MQSFHSHIILCYKARILFGYFCFDLWQCFRCDAFKCVDIFLCCALKIKCSTRPTTSWCRPFGDKKRRHTRLTHTTLEIHMQIGVPLVKRLRFTIVWYEFYFDFCLVLGRRVHKSIAVNRKHQITPKTRSRFKGKRWKIENRRYRRR